MLGLVPGPGDVLGVGLVVLGESVPMPPAPPELDPLEDEPDVDPGPIPDELPPDSAGMEELPLLEAPPLLLPDCPLLSESMELPDEPPDELPLELDPDVPLLPEPEVPPPEPPPVMPEHATISIAQATDINHLVIDLSR